MLMTDDVAGGHQLARKEIKLCGQRKEGESEHCLICLIQKL